MDRVSPLMTGMGIRFNDDELKNFIDFAKSKETPDRIYYEDYVHRLSTMVNKHTEKIYKIGPKNE